MTKKNNTFFNISFFIILAMSVLSQHSFGQSCMSMSNCTTVSATLASFTTENTITITTSTQANDLKDINSKLVYIPSGITFTGNINNVDASSVFCIDVGAVFSPSSMTNFSGTIRNYSSSITLSNSYSGSIENYGGIINVTETSELKSGKHILNCSGTINWSESLNAGNSPNSIYNGGSFNVGTSQSDQMTGSACITNDAWMTIKNYVGSNAFYNNGKVEITGTNLHFNSGSIVHNFCTFFSNVSGSSFQSNENINNYGLIYFPEGTWENKDQKTFLNGPTGVVRTSNLVNEGIVEGSGFFYVSDSSEIKNQGKFGIDNKGLHFYDATYSGATSKFDKGQTSSNVGSNVSFAQFPIPEYTPDLSLYQCSKLILSKSVDPGIIGSDQTVCNGIQPVAFSSIENASMEGADNISYEWQYRFPGNTYFTTIPSATSSVYDPDTATVNIEYRRRASAKFNNDPVKNCTMPSNIVTITVSTASSPSVTTNPTSSSVCENSQAQFTASGQNYNSLQWQESQDNGVNWADLSNTIPYSGATTNTLTINPASTSMNGRLYRLALISNNCGTVYSTPATLTVITNDAPVISTQPADRIVCIGSTSAQFSVASSSTVKSYRWQVSSDNGANWTNCSGDNYSGETTNTLTVNSGGLTNEHQFRCVLTATCNATTSNAATLYVVTPKVKVTPVDDSPKCPDTEIALGFNGLDNDYRMGNSRVVFIIEQLSQGPFDWKFTYTLTLSNDDLLADNPSQETSQTITVDRTNDEYELVFYLENQTTSSVDVTMTLSNVSVAGCTETSSGNPDHTATIQVRRLPVSGQFITN